MMGGVGRGAIVLDASLRSKTKARRLEREGKKNLLSSLFSFFPLLAFLRACSAIYFAPLPTQGKKRFFNPLVHWTSNVQILVVRKLNLLVQKNY